MPPTRHKGAVAASFLFLVAACSDGRPGPKGPDLEASADSQARDSSRPEVAVRGGAGSAIFWTTNGGNVIAAEFDSRREQAGTRITWPRNGDATVRLDDLESRRFVLLRERDPNRVDCFVHEGNGTFVRAFAVVKTQSGHAFADILQSAAFDGQLIGQIDLGTQTGSFALVAGSLADLGPITPVPAGLVGLVEGASLGATGSVPGTVRALRLCAIGLLPILLGDSWRDLTGGATVLWLLAALRGETIVDFAAAQFRHGDPTMQEHLDHAMRQIVDPASPPIGSFWDEWSSCILDGLPFRDEVLEDARLLFQLRPSPLPTLGNLQLPAAFTLPLGGPPRVTVTVSGQCVLQNGAVFVLTGTVDANGSVSCSGIQGGSTLVLIGLLGAIGFDGACNLDGVDGTGTGTQQNFGACNEAQESGGRGTFTFAHYVGGGTGTVTFSYNAYDIEDQFVVRTVVGERFSTSGLVSGSQTVPIVLNDEPIVFVSVSAPTQGTVWDYTLSCLQ